MTFTDFEYGVVTLPDAVDSTVQQIALTYEIRGMVQGITSLNIPSGGTSANVVNDVQRVYNGFRQPITEYQEHAGAVNTSTSLNVQYSFADGSANTIRPTGVTYPNGNTLAYDYGTSGLANDLLSRVQGLISSLSTGDVAAYSYLGLGTPVQVQYLLAGIQYNLATGTSPNLYPGLDNFGRVIDCRWQTTSESADLARLQYWYDQASNRLWRLDAVAQSMGQRFDEIYSNDGLYRLTNMRRGQLNGAQTAFVSGTQTFEQTWTLDPTGNWNGITEQATGSGVTLDQARTANPVNQITAILNSVGSAGTQPGYDAAGNMTTMPQPNAPGSQFTGIFDGWQRLVKLVDPSTGETVQVNQYDGRNFRVVRETYSSGTLSETRQFYHSMSWQVLEERVGADPNTAVLDRQYTWGLRYIDDLVLRDRFTSGTLSERLYAMQDANWNMVALYNAAVSAVAERYAYSAYGVCSFLDANFNALTGSAYEWTVLYTGRELDAVTGLFYYRNRYYLALLGILVNRDPIGFSGADVNLYRYVGNGPANRIDPRGLVSNGSNQMEMLLGFYSQAESNAARSNFPIAPIRTLRSMPETLSPNDNLPQNAVSTTVIKFSSLQGPGLGRETPSGTLYQCNNQNIDAAGKSVLRPTGKILVVDSLPGNADVLKGTLGKDADFEAFSSNFSLASAILKYPANSFDVIVVEGHHYSAGIPPFSLFIANQGAVALNAAVNEAIDTRLKKDGVLIIASCDAALDPALNDEAKSLSHSMIVTDKEQCFLVTAPGGHWFILPSKKCPQAK
jgi:RHS repeat-associated protein